jgi:hypothetical protein
MDNFIRRFSKQCDEFFSQELDELERRKEDLYNDEEYPYGDPLILKNSRDLFSSVKYKAFVICVIKAFLRQNPNTSGGVDYSFINEINELNDLLHPSEIEDKHASIIYHYAWKITKTGDWIVIKPQLRNQNVNFINIIESCGFESYASVMSSKIDYDKVRRVYIIAIVTRSIIKDSSSYATHHHPQHVATYQYEMGEISYIIINLFEFDIPFDQLKDGRDVVTWGLKHGSNLIKKEVDVVMAEYPDFKNFFQSLISIRLTPEKRQIYDLILELYSMIISFQESTQKGFNKDREEAGDPINKDREEAGDPISEHYLDANTAQISIKDHNRRLAAVKMLKDGLGINDITVELGWFNEDTERLKEDFDKECIDNPKIHQFLENQIKELEAIEKKAEQLNSPLTLFQTLNYLIGILKFYSQEMMTSQLLTDN